MTRAVTTTARTDCPGGESGGGGEPGVPEPPEGLVDRAALLGGGSPADEPGAVCAEAGWTSAAVTRRLGGAPAAAPGCALGIASTAPTAMAATVPLTAAAM